jgi:hypothetical protein
MKRAILLALLLQANLAGAVFKCVDEKGVTRIGETPPDECASVVMYELRANGTVLRKVDPTPTPDQVKVKQDAEARKREVDKVAAVQKRKDDALLSTYSNEREFDVTRDRNIEPIKGRIRGGEERIKLIEEREGRVAEQLEFYKEGKGKAKGKQTDAPPPALVAEQESLAKEKDSLRAMIVRQRKEIDDLRARYDTDKQRWIALKSGRLDAIAAPVPAPAPAQPPAAANPQPVKKTY